MKTVSRDELYEQVWARPMIKVAADYGVTGTALKKTCDRHRIPTPDRGYWAKLEFGKPVKKEPLPHLAEPNLGMVRIAGGSEQRLPSTVREAREKARRRLDKQAGTDPVPVAASNLTRNIAEPSFLAATRSAISKARPDDQGFATVRSKGVVPLRIAPASIERGMSILIQLFALAETQGYSPKATKDGLTLLVENEPIAFGLEEQPEKTLHQPTSAELKRRDERMRWGYSNDPWPKYDQSPSGRLALIIHANSYSGLRRTYSDGKTQTVERMLPDMPRSSSSVGKKTKSESVAIEPLKPSADMRRLSIAEKNAAWSLSMQFMSNWSIGTNSTRCLPISKTRQQRMLLE